MFEEYYEKPYWIIDILPEQVPEGGEGQYFSIEQYYLQKPKRSELQKTFLDLLLKLNCYYDFKVWPEKHNYLEHNPSPELLEEWMMKQEEILHIELPSAESLIVARPDDLYMTVYNPDEKLLGMLQKLAQTQGLFVWKQKKIVG